jgi:lysophospholipase L1-like esterase
MLQEVRGRIIATNRSKILKFCCLVTVSLIFGLTMAELGVRCYALIGGALGKRLAQFDFDPIAVPIKAYGKYGYRQKPNRTFPYGNGAFAHSNERGYRGPVVADTKQANTIRIILLGGSTTHGFGVPDDGTIDSHLRRILNKRFPDSQFEAVNIAYDGYDSYQQLLRMETDGVRLSPDIVIVNSGINDVRNAHIPDLTYPDPRTNGWRQVLASVAEEEANGSSVWTLAKRYSYFIRLPVFLHSIYNERQLIKQQRGLVQPNLRAIDNFEINLREIARLGKMVGAELIFSTPPSSLSERYKPTDTSTVSYWVVDAGTTQVFRDLIAKKMRQVAFDVKAGYVYQSLRPELFLDDCHLTSEGNLAVANNFADAITPLVESKIKERLGR